MDGTFELNRESIAGISTGKMGMWVFLVSEIMFFTGLIGSAIVLRLGSASWPNPLEVLNIPLLALNTIILLTSSLTMALSVEAAETGRTGKLVRNLGATAFLGTAFLAIKIFDYVHMWNDGFTISSHLFGSCYYLITAFHGLHVLSGVILLLTLIRGARLGRYSSSHFGRVECIGLYWHFVDVVWVVVFAALCLL